MISVQDKTTFKPTPEASIACRPDTTLCIWQDTQTFQEIPLKSTINEGNISLPCAHAKSLRIFQAWESKFLNKGKENVGYWKYEEAC